jgi:hypothetical protein
MKNDIYRSKVLGDERTEPILAVLPAADADMVEELKRLRAIVKLGDDAITTIRAIQANCKHHYFRDTAGFPYDVRTCAVCGASMGQV